jgi:hypothetical protein
MDTGLDQGLAIPGCHSCGPRPHGLAEGPSLGGDRRVVQAEGSDHLGATPPSFVEPALRTLEAGRAGGCDPD